MNCSAWWLLPTTVLRYEGKDRRWFLNKWGTLLGRFFASGSMLWTYPLPEPRESFFKWSQSWTVRRSNPDYTLKPRKHTHHSYSAYRGDYRHKPRSAFQKAQAERHWQWRRRVEHLFDVPAREELKKG